MRVEGTLDMTAEAQWSQSQTRRIQLDCITAEDNVIINLPSIASILAVNGGDITVIINDYSMLSETNDITINCHEDDYIDVAGLGELLLQTNGASIALEISSDQSWLSQASVPASIQGVSRKIVIALSSDGEAMTNTILYSDLETPILITQTTTGTSTIDLNGNTRPDNAWCNSNFEDETGLFRAWIEWTGAISQYRQAISSDGGDTWIDGDYAFDSAGVAFATITFEYYV